MALVTSYGPDYTQAPTDKLDYNFDWLGNGWLPTGDTIASSSWTATPTSGTPSTPTLSGQSTTANDTTVWFTGGSDMADYVLYNQITTTAGRIRTRSILIRVRSQQ
jgi:hypothetical protein